jgi:TFIIF-interacting CTD phosphatase-like protein
MDPSGDLISHILHRDHIKLVKNISIKDLSRLGRDISKVIIVDNIAENFML